MTTQKQIEANRRSASKSTGPKSAEGKARSKWNSLKHGLLVRGVILAKEDELQFKGLVRDLATDLEPEGFLEEQLVRRIVVCYWRLKRVYQIESDIFECRKAITDLFHAKNRLRDIQFNSGEDAVIRMASMGITADNSKHNSAKDEVQRAENEVERTSTTLGAVFKEDADGSNAFSKLSRYETGIERSLFRAIHELQRLQAARKEGRTIVPAAVDVTVDRPPVRHRSRPKLEKK